MHEVIMSLILDNQFKMETFFKSHITNEVVSEWSGGTTPLPFKRSGNVYLYTPDGEMSLYILGEVN